MNLICKVKLCKVKLIIIKNKDYYLIKTLYRFKNGQIKMI